MKKSFPLLIGAAAIVMIASITTAQPDVDQPEEPKEVKANVVVVKKVAGDVQPTVISTTDVDAVTGALATTATASVLVGNDKESKISVVMKGTGDLAADPNRGWLGVYIGEVHTKSIVGTKEEIESNSLEILGIVDDSPAAEAGLQKGDIITAINGEAVEGGITGGIDRIAKLGPGTEITLDVLRDEEPMTFDVTLGSRPALPDGTTINNRFYVTKPRVFNLNSSGGLSNLTEDNFNFKFQLPNIAQTTIQVEDGQQTISIVNTDDDETIEITQTGDGPIIVKRKATGEDDFVETEYATAEELQAADEIAYGLYDKFRNGMQIQTFEIQENLDLSNLDEYMDNIQIYMDDLGEQFENIKIESNIEGAQEALNEAMEQLKAEGMDFHTIDLRGVGEGEFNVFTTGSPSKAKRTITVNPDGQIEVKLRKGDTEVVKLYSDEEDLKARDPESFEKYSDIMETEPVD